MAQVRPKPVRPIDPNSPEAKEQARIKADQAASKRLQAEKKEHRDQVAAEDGEKTAAEKAAHQQAAQEVVERQKREREEHLKKPLTAQEQAEYESLEAQANSGKPVAATSMKLLGDYRTRLKNTGRKKPPKE